jgi:hypothetical protein
MLGEIAVEGEDDDEDEYDCCSDTPPSSFFGFDKGVRPSFLYPILMVSLEIL